MSELNKFQVCLAQMQYLNSSLNLSHNDKEQLFALGRHGKKSKDILSQIASIEKSESYYENDFQKLYDAIMNDIFMQIS